MAAPIPPELLVCVCGTRGCEMAAQHCTAFVGTTRGPKGSLVKRMRVRRRRCRRRD